MDKLLLRAATVAYVASWVLPAVRSSTLYAFAAGAR